MFCSKWWEVDQKDAKIWVLCLPWIAELTRPGIACPLDFSLCWDQFPHSLKHWDIWFLFFVFKGIESFRMNFGCMLENSPNNHNLNNIDLQFFLNKNALLLESRVGYTRKWQRPGISLSCLYTILNKTLGSRYKDQLSCLHSSQEDRGHRSLIFSFYGHRNTPFDTSAVCHWSEQNHLGAHIWRLTLHGYASWQ